MSQVAWPPEVDIHHLFGPDLTPPGGLDWNRIQAFARFALEAFVGQIAIAFGGISIAGWKPFDFLADWGQARIDEAQANYLAATNAQGSANFALTQLGVTLSSNVTGGVSIRELFNGSSASDLGANFTRTVSGSGSGTYGPNGSGDAQWIRSGGLSRLFQDRHNTALATDYQAVQFLLTTVCQAPFGGGTASNWLRLRINPSDDTFVFARITHNSLAIGCWVSGTETVFPGGTFSLIPKDGQVWRFVAGTTGDVREFVVQCNDTEVARVTDIAAVSQYGSIALGAADDYLYPGCAERAANRSVSTPFGNAPNQSQTIPGNMSFLAAADLAPAA